MKCGEKLGKLIYLERRLEGKSIESKIIKFGSRFVEKSSSEVERNLKMKVLQKIEIKN